MYPMVSTTVFQGLTCMQLGQDEYRLVADFQLDCPDGVSPLWLASLVATFLVPIGVPTLLLFLLFASRGEMHAVQSRARERYMCDPPTSTRGGVSRHTIHASVVLRSAYLRREEHAAQGARCL